MGLVSSALAAPKGMDISTKATEPARQSDRRVDDSKWLSTLFSAAVWRKGAAVSDCVVSVEVGRRMASAVPHASPASD